MTDPYRLPEDWTAALAPTLESDEFAALKEFVASERAGHTVYPPPTEVMSAFRLTPLATTRVFILGQDPYHGAGQAHGLCFSVNRGVKIPPSLRNMFKELESDFGIPPASHGHLGRWAKQGVLMTNAVLTVREAEPNSHKRRGWEAFTDAVIRVLNDRDHPMVFVLWGGYAKKKARLIDGNKHVVIESAHPSPLSVHRGFYGSKPYSKINEALIGFGYDPIDWRLSEGG